VFHGPPAQSGLNAFSPPFHRAFQRPSFGGRCFVSHQHIRAMTSSNKEDDRRWTTRKTLIAALAFLSLCAFATTMYLWNQNREMAANVNNGKLYGERLFAEKLQLEKHIIELNSHLDRRQEALEGSEQRVDELRRRVEEAVQRSRGLQHLTTKNDALTKEVAGLKAVKEQLELELSTAGNNERYLQGQLGQVTSERDSLMVSLEERKAGAGMVNNAEVDALRGKKGRLTVIARRTREIRMAFDLPPSLAQGTTFNIITPDGQSIKGSDPRISMSIDDAGSESLASINCMAGSLGNERASRVHLRYTPTDKLKAGTYRIDVMSGGDHLNSVLLNLR
jgi:hypothetical protein